MFVSTIKKNTEAVVEQIGSGCSLSINSLIELDSLQDIYKNMITAERDIWVFKEKLKLAANPFFDFDSDLHHSPSEFDEFLKKIAVVPFDNLPAFVESLIRLRLNFLCRPRTTLKYFIFKESITVSFDEFMNYFAFFSDYDYLYQSFYDYSARQTALGKRNIAVYEFEQLISRFDNSYIYEMDSEAFLDLVSPIFEFFNIEYPPDINLTAPAEALALFFDDKNMKYVSSIIQSKFRNKELSKSELIDLFKEALLPIGSQQSDVDITINEDLPSNQFATDEMALDEQPEEVDMNFDIINDFENFKSEKESKDHKLEEIYEEISQNDVEMDSSADIFDLMKEFSDEDNSVENEEFGTNEGDASIADTLATIEEICDDVLESDTEPIDSDNIEHDLKDGSIIDISSEFESSDDNNSIAENEIDEEIDVESELLKEMNDFFDFDEILIETPELETIEDNTLLTEYSETEDIDLELQEFHDLLNSEKDQDTKEESLNSDDIPNEVIADIAAATLAIIEDEPYFNDEDFHESNDEDAISSELIERKTFSSIFGSEALENEEDSYASEEFENLMEGLGVSQPNELEKGVLDSIGELEPDELGLESVETNSERLIEFNVDMINSMQGYNENYLDTNDDMEKDIYFMNVKR